MARIFEILPSHKPVMVDSFCVNGFTHLLSRPINIVPTTKDGVTSAVYEPLGIDVYVEEGESIRDAIEEDLAWKWQNFVDADVKTLAPDALFVRNALLDYVNTPNALLG